MRVVEVEQKRISRREWFVGKKWNIGMAVIRRTVLFSRV
jgi:hypothetical protein